MPDLLLHIGLLKTGTTTLQKRVLPRYPGYLGVAGQLGAPHGDGGLYKLYLRTVRGRPADLRQWLDRIDGLADGRSRLLISHENLSLFQEGGLYPAPVSPQITDRTHPGRSGDPTFPDFLEQHLLPAWGDRGRIEVIMTLRNQSDWLASFYAQTSDWMIDANQRDFEEQIAWLLQHHDTSLEFDRLVRRCREVVGADRTHVLLFEDMAEPAYWRSWSDILGHDVGPAGGSAPVENRRSSGDEWLIRPFSKKALQALFGRRQSREDPRDWTLRILRHPRVLIRALTSRRGASITLPDALRLRIRTHLAGSNQRLSELLGRDLTPLGY